MRAPSKKSQYIPEANGHSITSHTNTYRFAAYSGHKFLDNPSACSKALTRHEVIYSEPSSVCRRYQKLCGTYRCQSAAFLAQHWIFVHSRLNSTCRSLVMLVSLFVSVRVYVSVCLSICLSVFLSICVCVSVCVCVCVCVWVVGMSLCFAVIPADSASWRMRCVAKVTKIPPKHLQDYGSTAASPAHTSMTDCQGQLAIQSFWVFECGAAFEVSSTAGTGGTW